MKLNEWIPLRKMTAIPKEVQFINCDTRDFHIFLSTEPSSIQEQILANITKNTDRCLYYLIPQILKHLQDITGGEGDWRHIELKNKKWLKYIWFIRHDDLHFVVATREGELLDPDKIEEMIDFSNPYLMTE